MIDWSFELLVVLGFEFVFVVENDFVDFADNKVIVVFSLLVVRIGPEERNNLFANRLELLVGGV